MDSLQFLDIPGANRSLGDFLVYNFSTINVTESKFYNKELPPSLMEISDSSLACVFAYCLVFIIATSENAFVLSSLWREYKTKHSRISLLFLHLTIADLIVCCILIPTEIFWRLTIQWWGGSLLCKATQFLRAFGLYLSSLVLICVSVDRFLAIIFPLNVIKVGSYHRIKVMLMSAWMLAAVFSIPQAIFFGVEPHPEFPSFKQCVTNDFLDNPKHVKIYSIFSVAMMYFVPLFVIIITYSAIICKLVRKSHETIMNAENGNIRISIYRRRARQTGDKTSAKPMILLRCSSNAEANISTAKTRTLLMTVVIVLAFVFCWTPYAIMTLWYMVDWKGAAEVNPAVQDALFLMAVANSCISPWIYRSFSKNLKMKSLCFCC